MRFSILNSDAERRDGLKALLRQIDRLARFHEAQDWRQVVRAFKRQRPDLLVIDWQDWMSVADTRHLLSHYPDLRVAVLTDHISPDVVRELMDEGVLGVVPRETDPCLIVRAFEMVLLGGHYVPPGALALNPPLPPDATIRPFDEKNPPPRRTKLSNGLSPRQQQIMRCVHMGSTNKMIARTLGISEGTVKIHLTSIFQQLGAPNRAAAVALYNGWLSAQLQVLRNCGEASTRPVMGQTGVVPLRRRTQRRFRYPLPANDTPGSLPMAAEPALPYGNAAAGAPAPELEPMGQGPA
ncbi:response regulator transcription factor [Paraburkholderia terricola]|jgi:DNA-binding NarL/FixJ family response regulator|uniref:DNA-binding NarL/FixJ family response regulator n=1 Tax=Paraburkholderia terricola TaxID=169427 RepID=A0ABU1LWQ9_9BURK|nr:response regulator transcription factor [Paraburkholderia terricola]MDR6411192.1 DNA-binding NarL/FixJ family response regulator [Paraburkholderia terricola]MDR6483568.1 DNA-binding NarL/FixJ family response regulator [Paraburkholderia terricola]